jgi:hypothetical protein
MFPNSVSAVVIACSVAKTSRSGAQGWAIRRGKAGSRGSRDEMRPSSPVEPGDVGAGNLLLYPGEIGLPRQIPSPGGRQVEKPGENGLPFAEEEEVEEVGEGFGVQRDRDAARDDQRIRLSPVRGQKGDSRHLQHLQDLRIVVLEGEGEGDDVEVGEGPLRFDADQRVGAIPGGVAAGIGEEDPFAQAVGVGVDQRIDGLEAEVGHPGPVEVRIGEADRQGLSPHLPGPPLFTGEEIQASLLFFPGHDTQLAPNRP